MQAATPDRMVIVIDDDIATFKALSRLGPQGGYATKSFACCWDFVQWIKGPEFDAFAAGLTLCLVIDAKALVSDASWYVNEHISQIPKICIGLPATTAPLSHLMNSFEGEFIRKPFTLAKISGSIEAAFGCHAHRVESTRQADMVQTLFALLSPRELEVADLVGAGLPNLDIAHKLGITLKTVKAHRAKVMGKTQSSTIAAFVGKHNQYRETLAKRHNVQVSAVTGTEVTR